MRTRRREPRKAVEPLAHYDGELDDKRRDDAIGNCHRVSHPLARSLEDLLAGESRAHRVAGPWGDPAAGSKSLSAIGPDREKVMDWDDLKPKAPKGITLGESLESLSVAELDARIVSLEQEIERVKIELAQKKAHEAAAAAIFKR
jgi:uncharacterized small protein (DUF1192 family)